MNDPRLLPHVLLPFEENGNSFSLNARSFAERLLLFSEYVGNIAARDADIYDGSLSFLTSYAHNEVLGVSPTSLHADIQAAVFPALDNILYRKQPPYVHFEMLFRYAEALNRELKKQIVTPDFSSIPTQQVASTPFYMGQPENLFISKTKNPFFGGLDTKEGPTESWMRQIREVTGWRAIRDLIRHLGSEVKVLEPDAAVLSSVNDFGMHVPYTKLKFTRNQGIIIDDTFYMGGADNPLDSATLKDGGKAVVALLRDHFRQQMIRDGFKIKAIHPDTPGGNTIYDEINDVLFIGGIVTNSRDNMKLAAEEMALRKATGKTRVITVPLVDPGNLEGVREVVVGNDGSVVERVKEKARFYDMDTMMAVVNGRVIIYPAATTPLALQDIQRAYKARRVSYIHNETTALAYPFNNVSIGNVVISPFADDEVRAIFGKSGKLTVTPEDVGLP